MVLSEVTRDCRTLAVRAIKHKAAEELHQRDHAQNSESWRRRINNLTQSSFCQFHKFRLSGAARLTFAWPRKVASSGFSRDFIRGQTCLTLVVDAKFQNDKHQRRYSIVELLHLPGSGRPLTPNTSPPAPPLPLGRLRSSVRVDGEHARSPPDLRPPAQLSHSLRADPELGCSRRPPPGSLSGPITASGLLESGSRLVHRHQ